MLEGEDRGDAPLIEGTLSDVRRVGALNRAQLLLNRHDFNGAHEGHRLVRVGLDVINRGRLKSGSGHLWLLLGRRYRACILRKGQRRGPQTARLGRVSVLLQPPALLDGVG